MYEYLMTGCEMYEYFITACEMSESHGIMQNARGQTNLGYWQGSIDGSALTTEVYGTSEEPERHYFVNGG